ncbi:MAG: hypothetical protein SGILL_002873 [Bacillariaceae sp.]
MAAMAALATDDGVIKAQVAATMQTLLMAVQDNVMTDNKVLEQQELRSANWDADICNQHPHTVSAMTDETRAAEIVEQPVWGMDCYTRRNVAIVLETEFDGDTVHSFIEKWLLPAVNACPVDLAYDLSNAALILEGLPFDTSSTLNQESGTSMEEWKSTLLGEALVKKLKESSPSWLRSAAHILRRAIRSLGYDFFRVHPKGHGSIVLCPKIPPNRLVTFYRGEVYPSWRWGEKMDAITLIQEKKGLKPRLPDFYNMTLERPQRDPRGYGLLFVDASRKSGYGSMLSHSCNPSCEVKVVAIDGELTLAMTTLREMTVGEEVTFDYNAATDSLHEYQAAICLCGNVQCRGSFLHFATADCYQQVLNRNAPIAVRLSQLIKGCTKQVMAQEDSKILERHGFLTAAFGAVSVNRQKVTAGLFSDTELDSMEFVPIWLRTYIAETLRYIEYERRSLPIALICNEITKEPKSSKKEANPKPSAAKKPSSGSKKSTFPATKPDKPIKGHKPEPPFFFFYRSRREHFLTKYRETSDEVSVIGLALERDLKKMASIEWKSYSQEVKDHWKKQAHDEWKKNGGEEKARLEAQRVERLQKSNSSASSASVSRHATEKSDVLQGATEASDLETERISFQAADAEGMSAMEQRIQQLTHSLSRVGRILDRHREASLRKNGNVSVRTAGEMDPRELQNLTHSPLVIMPDEDVVAWMWNHEDGIVRTLLRMASNEVCVSPRLLSSLKLTESKFSMLSQLGTPWEGTVAVVDPSLKGENGRRLLNEALLEFRERLLEGMNSMATEIKKKKASSRENAKKKKKKASRVDTITTSSSQSQIRFAVTFTLNEMVETIEERSINHDAAKTNGNGNADLSEISEPWLLHYNKRFKLEKASDLLLMYTRTSTFFRIKPYEEIQSSAIEVYAREIGNEVPLSVMDKKPPPSTVVTSNQSTVGSSQVDVRSDTSCQPGKETVADLGKTKASGICDPEDIVSEVTVSYQGDYVLSQLLQWYNGGFDQKPGLPDILGCCLLPSMTGCFTIDTTKSSSSSTDKRTGYVERTRPRLVEWLKDPYKRGSAWPDEVRRAFVDKEQDKVISDASKCWLPIGSPVLDLLVTGDDLNVMEILGYLGSKTGSHEEDNEGLLSTIDHGRPAQAVSNWVQCENEDCQKWRKIPWNVDVDLISQRFVCSDNKWNPSSASCDAPEDDWDEENDACVEADGSVKPREVDTSQSEELEVESQRGEANRCNLIDFQIGARFDVLRVAKRKKWCPATVVDIDFIGQTRRVKFHFPRTQLKSDVWLDADSRSIAPLHTHSSPLEPRKQVKPPVKKKGSKSTKRKAKKADDDTSSSGSSFDMAESGSEDVDGRDETENIGVGVVESFEDIGDADTEDYENKKVSGHLNHDDDKDTPEEEENLDGDDDGLNDEMEDDSEVESVTDKKGGPSDTAYTSGAAAAVTVTDQSSPDSETHGIVPGGAVKSFKIPKKRPSGEVSPSRTIPRKSPSSKSDSQNESPKTGGNHRIPKKAKLSPSNTRNRGPDQYLSLNKSSPSASRYSCPDQYLSLNKQSTAALRASQSATSRVQYQTSQERAGFRPASLPLHNDRKPELRLNRESEIVERQLHRYDTTRPVELPRQNVSDRGHAARNMELYQDDDQRRSLVFDSDRRAGSTSHTKARDDHHHGQEYHRDRYEETRRSYNIDEYENFRSRRGYEDSFRESESSQRVSYRESYRDGSDFYERDESPRRRSLYHRSSERDAYPIDREYPQDDRSYDRYGDERIAGAGSWKEDDYHSRSESPSKRTREGGFASRDNDWGKKAPSGGYDEKITTGKPTSRGYDVQSVKAKSDTNRKSQTGDQERSRGSRDHDSISSRHRGYDVQSVKAKSDNGREPDRSYGSRDKDSYSSPRNSRRRRDDSKTGRYDYDDREEHSFRRERPQYDYDSPRRKKKDDNRRSHHGGDYDDRGGQREYSRRASDHSRYNERRHDPYGDRN